MLTTLALTSLLLTPLNDGGLTSGGSPRLLIGHPTIRMESEVIRIKIRNRIVTTDCRFTFVNDGPACDVQMGFPDQGFGASNPRFDTDASWQDWKPVSVFKSFLSWVDGQPTKTTLVKGQDEDSVFQAKTVHFGAKAKVNVRDLYTASEGYGAVDGGRLFSESTGYILSTGASWKGNIGSTVVSIEFDPKRPIREVRYADKGEDLWTIDFSTTFLDPAFGARCKGPIEPVFANNSLTFKIKNWRPTKDSDILVEYSAGLSRE